MFLLALVLFFGFIKSEDNIGVLSLREIDEALADQFKPNAVVVESGNPHSEIYSSSGAEPSGVDEPGDGDLISIIESFNTDDPEHLVSELLWYSAHFYGDHDSIGKWKNHTEKLTGLYMNYLDGLLELPNEKKWRGYEQNIVLLYSELASISKDNIEKTSYYIKIINFLEDNYYPKSFDDNYMMGKAFLRLSLYHPGEMSREGCKIQAINYFANARDGSLILALQDFYNELAHTYDTMVTCPLI